MKQKQKKFIHPIVWVIVLNTPYAHSEDFNSSFLKGSVSSQSWNNDSIRLLSGTYEIDSYVNNHWRGKIHYTLKNNNIALINKSDIKSLGVKVGKEIVSSNSDTDWMPLDDLLEGVEYKLDTGKMRMDIIVPQAFFIKDGDKWYSPEQFDKSISGAYTNYNANYYHVWRKDGFSDSDNIYLTLTNGINLTNWHLIDKSIFMRNRTLNNGKWYNNERYVERALPYMKAKMRIGESNTNSKWFDSVRYKGIEIKQEIKMYPDSFKTYMPVILGIAKTNSSVRIYQNGYLLFQDNVPPGPFEFRELMPTGSRNDLTVIVEGSDGTKDSFIIPYSTINDMLRSGSFEWQLNAGKTDEKYTYFDSQFIQSSFSYGLNNYITLYSGGTISPNYKSAIIGTAYSLPYIGSFSTNIELMNTKLLNNQKYSGERYGISWSHYFLTKTNLTLGAYYYNSSDYLSFSDYVNVNSLYRQGSDIKTYNRNKRSYNINLEQQFDEGLGRVSFQGYWRNYWNSSNQIRQYSLSYSNLLMNIAYNISFSRIHYEYKEHDYSSEFDEIDYGKKRSDENRVDLSITIPFNFLDNNSTVTSNFSMKNEKYSASTLGFSSASQQNDYSINFTDSANSKYKSLSVYNNTRTPWVKINTNATNSSNYRQIGGGASGTVMIWNEGLLLSGQNGTSFVILDAPGVANARVNNNYTITTNKYGKVLVPTASAYRLNTFRLTSGEDTSDAELLGNTAYSIPWYGGISYVKYQTDQRKVFSYKAIMDNGNPLPFSAVIKDINLIDTGYVAQGSQLYVKAKDNPRKLYVYGQDKGKGFTILCTIHNPKQDNINVCKH